eukprot:Nitzschia sp. Nitz4//scaffold53_size117307//112972//113783//NITZ4_003786-RA/size117307-snap-gene-0.119-mRNA-1//-1//CDS//3329554253//6630//frame0
MNYQNIENLATRFTFLVPAACAQSSIGISRSVDANNTCDVKDSIDDTVIPRDASIQLWIKEVTTTFRAWVWLLHSIELHVRIFQVRFSVVGIIRIRNLLPQVGGGSMFDFLTLKHGYPGSQFSLRSFGRLWRFTFTFFRMNLRDDSGHGWSDEEAGIVSLSILHRKFGCIVVINLGVLSSNSKTYFPSHKLHRVALDPFSQCFTKEGRPAQA